MGYVLVCVFCCLDVLQQILSFEISFTYHSGQPSRQDLLRLQYQQLHPYLIKLIKILLVALHLTIDVR